jgi:hypothetical protein
MSAPENERGEAREMLDRLLYAREQLAEGLRQIVDQASAQKWDLADADWDVLEAATAKLEALAAAGQRAQGIKPPNAPGPSAKT